MKPLNLHASLYIFFLEETQSFISFSVGPMCRPKFRGPGLQVREWAFFAQRVTGRFCFPSCHHILCTIPSKRFQLTFVSLSFRQSLLCWKTTIHHQISVNSFARYGIAEGGLFAGPACLCVYTLGVGFVQFAVNPGPADWGQGPRQSRKANQSPHS